jgi:fido (protein-threonine AMPylation protein)
VLEEDGKMTVLPVLSYIIPYLCTDGLHSGNITKQEWVLNGETVLYASAESLKATPEYGFQQEKMFSYAGLSRHEIIEHIAYFISYLWQIHVFGEGNTHITAIFLIKYLRKLGFREVNNNLFAHLRGFSEMPL